MAFVPGGDHGDEVTIFCSHDTQELARTAAGDGETITAPG